ncbi:MAG: DUF4255 domain-containing protein [Gilvibacter sp.]
MKTESRNALPLCIDYQMIYQALEIIKDQASNYLEAQLQTAGLVVLENIAKLDEPGFNTITDKVVLTLINMEEEVTLKNQPTSYIRNDETHYKNQPIHLNLYVLFSVNRTGYDNSLNALSTVIEFFQSKKIFTNANTVLNPAIPALAEVTEFKLTVDLYTPTFEQQNYIWGTLGGKSIPNAMFKVTLVKIDSSRLLQKGTQISSAESTALPI